MTKDGEMAQREGSSTKPALEKVQWVHWEQDHDARKKAIMEKHGDKVRALMVEDSQTLWWVTAMVLGQLFLSVQFSQGSWLSFFGWAYLGGTFLTHALFLAIHEVTHHTVFKKQWMNHAVAMWANIPIVVPYAMTFRDYHADHHRYLNWDGTDADVPTHLEMRLLDSFGGKFFFLAFQIFFYAFRPMFVKFKPLKTRHIVAIGVQGAFIALWLSLWGIWPLAFLIVSDLLAGTFSLTSGHFIAEHYNVYGAHVHQDTFSYYGALNWLCYNVGYHNEHHDFPNIPWTRLPELRRIAAEFYDPLVQTESWFGTSMKFLFDPNVGLYSRTRRERGAASRKDLMKTDVEPNPYLNKLLDDCKKCK